MWEFLGSIPWWLFPLLSLLGAVIAVRSAVQHIVRGEDELSQLRHRCHMAETTLRNVMKRQESFNALLSTQNEALEERVRQLELRLQGGPYRGVA